MAVPFHGDGPVREFRSAVRRVIGFPTHQHSDPIRYPNAEGSPQKRCHPMRRRPPLFWADQRGPERQMRRTLRLQRQKAFSSTHDSIAGTKPAVTIECAARSPLARLMQIRGAVKFPLSQWLPQSTPAARQANPARLAQSKSRAGRG